MKISVHIILFCLLISCGATIKSKKSKPLYVVNGVVLSTIDTLDPLNIEEIHVLKGKSAAEAYGRKGKHGVIQIKTK